MSLYYSLFVSYSHKDEDFVRKEIVLPLKSAGVDNIFFAPYSIRTGDKWEPEIYRELDTKDRLLLVVSENSLLSEWVEKEFNYTQSLGKKFIPVYIQPPEKLKQSAELAQTIEDWQLDAIHMTRLDQEEKRFGNLLKLVDDLRIDSDPELDETPTSKSRPSRSRTNNGNTIWRWIGLLLLGFAAMVTAFLIGIPFPPIGLVSSIVSLIAIIYVFSGYGSAKATRVAIKEVGARSPEEYDMYLAGLEARKNGDFEKAAFHWSALLKQNPHFSNGFLQKDYDRLMEEEVNPQKVQRLIDAANEASLYGNWTEVIECWTEIQKKEPTHPNIDKEIEVARKNASCSMFYRQAGLLVEKNEADLARDELRRLYENAPYYGDPSGIARKLGLGERVLYFQRKASLTEQYDAATRDLPIKRAALTALNQNIKQTKRQMATEEHTIGNAHPWLSCLVVGVIVFGCSASLAAMSFALAQTVSIQTQEYIRNGLLVISAAAGIWRLTRSKKYIRSLNERLAISRSKLERLVRERSSLEQQIKTLETNIRILREQLRTEVGLLQGGNLVEGIKDKLSKFRGVMGRR